MPSDTPLSLALGSVAHRIAAFRSALVAAHERAEALLAAGGGGERAALQLGPFARGHIDAGRLAALRESNEVLDAVSRGRVKRATAVLAELIGDEDRIFAANVRPGGDLHDTVANALAHLGRGFGAALTVGLVRVGLYAGAQHDRLEAEYPFASWAKRERTVAPPLVVRVDGADVHAAALADVLDGSVHIVLVVEGRCPPAALVRLITPGVLVLQTRDSTGLDRFADYDGPAIAAIVGADAATFLHDPACGNAPWQRLRIWERRKEPCKRIGGWSGRQQQDELDQLEALATRPRLSDTPVEALAPGSGDPVGRLASWLLESGGITP